MSLVVEAIAIPISLQQANNLSLLPGLGLEVCELNASSTLLVRGPGRVQFTERVDDFAALLSRDHGIALVLRFDDRIGHRSGNVYRQGELTATFGDEDEIWVPVDEDYEKILDGPRYTLEELDDLPDDVECETIETAVELACRDGGFCTWQEVLERV